VELFRFDPGSAVPLEGGANAMFVPIRRGDRMTAMLLQLDRRGDTGKREVPADVMLVTLSGEGRIRSGGHIADLKPGDVCLLPGGIMHQIWTSDSQLQVVLVTLPRIGSGA